MHSEHRNRAKSAQLARRPSQSLPQRLEDTQMATPTGTSAELITFRDPVLNALTQGSQWTLGQNRVITWGIANNPSQAIGNPSLASLQIAFALLPIEEVINVQFNYVGHFSDIRQSTADLTYTVAAGQLATTLFPGRQLAQAVFPYAPMGDQFAIKMTGTASGYQYAEGDVWLNGPVMAANGYSGFWDGAAGKFILLHETGHALGLKHPHDNGGTSRPTFADIGLSQNNRIEFTTGDGLDVDAMTIMSYSDDLSTNLWSGDPGTLMPLDIYALQAIYGPNLTTNAGDSIHKLVRDGVYRSVWDPSGIDWIDASSADTGWLILLETTSSNASLSAYFSHIALAIPLTGSQTFTNTTTQQWIYNAENIAGSAWGDLIFGNGNGNYILGNGGTDSIFGGDGNDVIDGGAGEDSLFGDAGSDSLIESIGKDKYDGGTGLDTLSAISLRRAQVILTRTSANGWNYRQTATGETDTLTDVEYIRFLDTTVSLLDLAFGSQTTPDLKGTQVYRFAKVDSGQYFYTGDISERNLIVSTLNNFRYEGPVFNAQDNWVTNYNPVYRFANLLNGGYFYTSSASERDTVFSDYAATYRYEGASFFVPASATADTIPVYRLANVKTGGYLFTANASERQFAQSLGFFRDEGIAFNAPRTISLAFDSSDEIQLSNDFSAEISNAGNAVISQFDWFV